MSGLEGFEEPLEALKSARIQPDPDSPSVQKRDNLVSTFVAVPQASVLGSTVAAIVWHILMFVDCIAKVVKVMGIHFPHGWTHRIYSKGHTLAKRQTRRPRSCKYMASIMLLEFMIRWRCWRCCSSIMMSNVCRHC
jgi:hypothetical protein